MTGIGKLNLAHFDHKVKKDQSRKRDESFLRMDRILVRRTYIPGLRPITNPVDSNGTVSFGGSHERHRAGRVGEGGENWPQLSTGLGVAGNVLDVQRAIT